MTAHPAHIFCDESGGSDRASGAFVTAAVAIVPADAQRLIKRFRKATGASGEVKGHRMTAEHRRIFFDLLHGQADTLAVAITCARDHAAGCWAMHALTEVDLYRHMMTEACMALPAAAGSNHLTVTLDGGRYKRTFGDAACVAIAEALGANQTALRVHVGFGHSWALAGLQVADVIANTVFQSLGEGSKPDIARSVLEALRGCGRLFVRPALLEGQRPAWLTDDPKHESRPAAA